MKYALKHKPLLAYNRDRVLAMITAQTANKGYVEVDEIRKAFNISTDDLVAIRDDLIAEGLIEEIA